MKRPEDEEHNILVSGMFATVSLIYTVLLAFLIISVWETFHAANQSVSQEAAALVTVARNKDIRLHIFMVLLLTCSITTCLWLIVILNDPFAGTLQVSSDPLKYALYVIDTLPR